MYSISGVAGNEECALGMELQLLKTMSMGSGVARAGPANSADTKQRRALVRVCDGRLAHGTGALLSLHFLCPAHWPGKHLQAPTVLDCRASLQSLAVSTCRVEISAADGACQMFC